MMNRGGRGNTNAARKVVRADIDEESLILFREMHKHEKDEVASLLLPVSEELEANDAGGGYGLYRVTSGRKNDYDWLKTPPATPLFPSLEMEANAPDLLIQKELPIIQPLVPSRFSDNSKATRAITARSTSPNPKTTKISPANLTATHKKSSARSSVVPAALNLKLNKSNNGPVANEKWNTTTSSLSSSSNVASAKSGIVKNKESNLNLLASNLSKSLGPMDSSSSTNKQPRSRGVSPLVRSKIPAQFPGFSDETPPNLRTDRSVSTARGRSAAADHQHKQQNQTITQNQRSSSVSRTRRQSCSPSVARGRKAPQVTEGNANKEGSMQQKGTTTTTSTRIMQHGNAQVLGSRMVDKFLNARKASSIHEGININDNKGKLNGSINESSGFGRMMSRNSLNMALKHMEIKQIESNNVGKNGMPTARKSTSNMRGSSISTRPTSNGMDMEGSREEDKEEAAIKDVRW